GLGINDAGAVVPAAPNSRTVIAYYPVSMGGGNNKAMELFNGTASGIDVVAGGYALHGAAAPCLTIDLNISAGGYLCAAAWRRIRYNSEQGRSDKYFKRVQRRYPLAGGIPFLRSQHRPPPRSLVNSVIYSASPK
ncbi:MAG: hypothetical protein ABI659_01920, partial [Nitrosospira sp.]